MIEEYRLGEVIGKDNQINWVTFFIDFKLEGTEYVTSMASSLRLGASLSAEASNDEIFAECLSSLGAEKLARIRERSYAELLKIKDKAESTQIIRKVEMEVVPRLYGRLVLINHGLWNNVVDYFSAPERTEEEKAFFEDAATWRKNDPVLQSAIQGLGLTQDQFNTLFDEAAAMLRADREGQ